MRPMQRIAVVLLWLGVSAAAFAQPKIAPPPQAPVELSNLPSTVDKVQPLPVPVGRQCMREATVPCRDDPARMCKQIEIANCD